MNFFEIEKLAIKSNISSLKAVITKIHQDNHGIEANPALNHGFFVGSGDITIEQLIPCVHNLPAN